MIRRNVMIRRNADLEVLPDLVLRVDLVPRNIANLDHVPDPRVTLNPDPRVDLDLVPCPLVLMINTNKLSYVIRL
jgi:hypothetical protein